MPTDMNPDIDEVLQVEPTDEPVVKVAVEGQVRTQELPTKRATAGAKLGVGTFTDSFGHVQILRADPRRKKATIVSPVDFYISFSDYGAQQQFTSCFWPAKVPCVVTAVTDVYVSSTAGTADIFFITESWATGDGAQ